MKTIAIFIHLFCLGLSFIAYGQTNTVNTLNKTNSTHSTLSFNQIEEKMREQNKRLVEEMVFSNTNDVNLKWAQLRINCKEDYIHRVMEQDAFRKGIYKEVSTLDEWLKQYRGKIYNPPIVFDFTDQWTPDFSTPEKALRSLWYCKNKCDAETILSNADPSFIYQYKVKLKDPWLAGSPKTYHNDGLTKITILMSGKIVLGGREFTMLFYRREHPAEPKKHVISFQDNYFVHLNGKYYLSEAIYSTEFADVYGIMGWGGFYPAREYKEMIEHLKKTKTPLSFYSIK